ncbi:hypothetical protein MHU86_10375 [Fragilaria crotonensis]|nr:hypothetical protein MHU86_10375 [Fragilaria crotonensis]
MASMAAKQRSSQGPHPGFRLAHQINSILHRARAARVAAGDNGASAEALSEDLEERNWVSGKAAGVDAQAVAKGNPQRPGGGGGDELRTRQALLGCLQNRAPISTELVAGGTVQTRHRNSWG